MEILIFFMLLVLMCAGSFCIGFYFGYKKKPTYTLKAPPPELTEEQKRKIRKREIEVQNMLTFDGTPQKDISV